MSETETKYFVSSYGLNCVDGPFTKEEAVKFLFEYCGEYAPPERVHSTNNWYQDVVKYYDKPLSGDYVKWNPTKLPEILADLDNVK